MHLKNGRMIRFEPEATGFQNPGLLTPLQRTEVETQDRCEDPQTPPICSPVSSPIVNSARYAQ